ncbi:MAG: hypothetical protein P8Z30_14975 [Acidobacteriota bacterium]
MLNSIRNIHSGRCLVQALALGLFVAGWLHAASKSAPVPQVNADIGPCTADFTVRQGANQPLYNAQISVKIAYGFMGMKKMDLKIGTDSEGKARFVGLPEKVHNPPLDFVVKAKGLTKTVHFWPSAKCRAQYAVVMGGR